MLCVTALAQAGVQDLLLPSYLNHRDVPIKVYTPPGYESSKERYPVVYNLHGGNGSAQRQWERTGATIEAAMRDKLVRPMIYVYADALGNTLYLDYAGGALRVESMIVKELIPFIDQRYRTIASHEGRAIDGFSMGGYGALMIAFRHPQLFSSVVSYGAAMLASDMIRIGGENGQFPSAEYVENHSPWGLLSKNKDRISEHLRIRMVCGELDEKWLPGNVKLKARLDELKVKAEWVPVAGVAHDTQGLYERVGVESLRFIEKGFAMPLERPEGYVRDYFLKSDRNRRDVLIKVYTPPGYESSGTQRYPVVYNLHGAGGGSAERQWSRARRTLKEALETGRVEPLIYVFVDGMGDTFFMDYEDGSVKAESFLTEELIPWVDQRYRTVAKREGRMIEGFSMGGAAAMRIGISRSDLFSTVVTYGAALIHADRNEGVRSRTMEKVNPWKIVVEAAPRLKEGTAIRMVCGDQDGLYGVNQEFRDRLRELGVAVEWEAVPGVAHDTKGLYERTGEAGLRFFARHSR